MDSPNRMKNRYRLVRRGERGSTFYLFDNLTRTRCRLNTQDPEEARRLLNAHSEARRQPEINLQIARAYLSASDEASRTRTWAQALDSLIETKTGPTKERWIRASNEKALKCLLGRVLVETQPEHFLAALKAGTVSTNVHLRKLHNFCLGMGWVAWPILPKKQWPTVRFKEKRAITWDEHLKIIDREPNAEKKAFYELAWHLGAAQSDLANLRAEDVDWQDRVISFRRKKTGTPSLVRFGSSTTMVLKRLPSTGYLFPDLQAVEEKRRADYFRKRCLTLGITGITLHSYRYAWAERAKTLGVNERHAMEMLGHNSKAVHRAYAKKAIVKVPSLEDFEIRTSQQNSLPPKSGNAK